MSLVPVSGGIEEGKEDENPFKLPPDDEVFLQRERARREKQEKKEGIKHLTLWEKTKLQSKHKGISRRGLDVPQDGEGSAKKENGNKKIGTVVAATSAISTERRREKENMTEFIAKKREMFLVQMSLDTKREEIRKLEEKAQLKEEALRKSELMLEEDAIRFDTFLKENDKKAHEAIKRAELETKLKHDKVQEIKKLNHQIQALQSDMSKLKEQLEDCLKYKAFLHELTPSEWFEEQTNVRQQQTRRARRAYMKIKLAEYEKEKARLMELHEEQKRKEDARSAGNKSRGAPADKKSSLPPPKLPDPPQFPWTDVALDESEDEGKHQEDDAREEKSSRESKSGENETSSLRRRNEEFEDMSVEELFRLCQSAQDTSVDDFPMYFTEPSQLLSIFTQLEESNLFLIQNSQETEQALEELKQEFHDTRQKMGVKTESLKENIDDLSDKIRSEKSKASLLHDRIEGNTGEDAQESLLRELNEKVKEVYKKCGFDCDASPATLSMITDLEAKLEDLLCQIEQMPEDYVVKAEKQKEKERRERVREERMSQQQQVYEERLRKSIERSMQAPKKKVGKPVMFRSAPPQKKERKLDDSAAEEKAQDMKDFFQW